MQVLETHTAPSLDTVRRLLDAAGLPASDLSDDLVRDFLVCGDPQAPDGVVGLELYGAEALLRSLVVAAPSRGRGCGKALVAAAEGRARARSVARMFLLTETAQGFFESLGYRVIDRNDAPEGIRRSREFTDLCPMSAAFMVKSLSP